MMRMPRGSRRITVVMLLLGAAGCARRVATSAVTSAIISAPPTAGTITVDGIVRTYVVRAPAVGGRAGPLPLVIVLHGGGGNAANAERMTGFTPKAMKEGFIVVYPNGNGALGDRLLTWNAGHCCAYALTNRIDDVAFISSLIDRLSREYPIDSRRIYATGMSNGGMMAHRLGIELSHRIAAIAPVVGTLFGDERVPKDRVSAIMINGELDRNVPPAGGTSGGNPGAWDAPARPAAEQGAFWARANGCGDAITQTDAVAAYTRYVCPAGKGVELYLVRNNGHAWPGGNRGTAAGDRPTNAFNATDVIWEFFRTHPK